MTARTPDAEPLLTPAEVATMFRVDPKTVTRWAKAASSRPSARSEDTVVTARLRSAHCLRVSRSSAVKPESSHNRTSQRIPQPVEASTPQLQATRVLPQQSSRPSVLPDEQGAS